MMKTEAGLNRTQKLLLAGFLVLMICGGVAQLFFSSDYYYKRLLKVNAVEFEKGGGVKQYAVDVDGAVRRPGVYRLPSGSTKLDAVKEAGGFERGAVTKDINLASKIKEGEKIFVPFSSGEVARNVDEYSPPDESAASPFAGKSEASAGAVDVKTGTDSKPPPKVIDLNKATEQDLQTLPGVGPAFAKRIITLRKQRGRFANVEEIMLVKGIGPKKFAQMKPYLRAE